MGGASELIFLSKTIPKIVKIFRPAAPKWGRRPSFDLRRAPQAGSGGVEAFLGENCPNPRDLSATSPAPEAFLAVPQHVIFAFRFQNELARVFFWGQNELAQFSSEGRFELALFFFWADFGFLLGPFRASSLSWLYRPGPSCSASYEYRFMNLRLLNESLRIGTRDAPAAAPAPVFGL